MYLFCMLVDRSVQAKLRHVSVALWIPTRVFREPANYPMLNGWVCKNRLEHTHTHKYTSAYKKSSVQVAVNKK